MALHGYEFHLQTVSGSGGIVNLVGSVSVNEAIKAYMEKGVVFCLYPSFRDGELYGVDVLPQEAVSKSEEYDRGHKDGYAKGLEASEKVAALEEEVARLNQLLNPTSDVSSASEGNGRRLIKRTEQEIISSYEDSIKDLRHLPKDV
jgi:hypothetical protein